MSARQRQACARQRAGHEGFTLIELMISLVAGLMVAMAVMGVSREATNTFHEEVRVSGAEMSIRIAMERLRMDLQRAAFMSTGNITGDPLIARAANLASGTLPYLSNVVTGTPIVAPLTTLSGVLIRPGGASVLTQVGTDTANGLVPDQIDIGGNLSSSDEYVASVLWPTKGVVTGCPTGLAISLQMNSPAAGRIVAAESLAGNTGSALAGIFHPGPSLSSQFLVRVTDQSGRYQYAVTAAGGANKGTTYYTAPAGTTPPVALICLDLKWSILMSSQTGGLGGVSGFGAGWVVVSPVEVVRWDIQTYAAATTAMNSAVGALAVPSTTYAYAATAAVPTSEYVLTRSYVDFSSSAATPTDPLTMEIIAEYAVDMKFGMTIDHSALCTAFPCPTAAPAYSGSASPLISIPAGDTVDMATYATYLTPAAPYAVNFGPQRIRDVEVRLGVRSQFADRSLNIAPSDAGVGGYLYRYSLPGSGSGSTALNYARVRENTSQVNLPNQARFYF